MALDPPRVMWDMPTASAPAASAHDYVENDLIADIADYLKRGRGLRSVASKILKRRWTVLFKEVSEGDAAHETERYDIEAELALRAEHPPMERVGREFRALLRKADAAYRSCRANPRLTADQAALLMAFECLRREWEDEVVAILARLF